MNDLDRELMGIYESPEARSARATELDYLIGLTYEEASIAARANTPITRIVRVVSDDGIPRLGQQDVRMDRVNVEMQDDAVARAYRG